MKRSFKQLYEEEGKSLNEIPRLTGHNYKRQVPIQELWEQERGNLLKLPQSPYRVFRYSTLVVNKYGFAVIDTNKYGLPPVLSGCPKFSKQFFP